MCILYFCATLTFCCAMFLKVIVWCKGEAMNAIETKGTATRRVWRQLETRCTPRTISLVMKKRLLSPSPASSKGFVYKARC